MNRIKLQTKLVFRIFAVIFSIDSSPAIKNEKIIKIKEFNISYKEEGKKGTPIIFIHGLGQSKSTWNKTMSDFSKNNKVFALYLPLFDDINSDIPLSLNEYSEIVKSFILKLKLKKLILIGHSFGGKIAIQLVYKNPNLVEKLVLYSTDLGFEKSLSRSVYFSLIKMADLKIFKPVLEIYFSIRKRSYDKFSNLAKSLILASNDNLLKPVAKIRIKTLLIYGKYDFIVSLNNGLTAKENNKKLKLEIFENSSHLAHEEEEYNFKTCLRNFINS